MTAKHFSPLFYTAVAVVALPLAAALLFFAVATIFAYRPVPQEVLYSKLQPQRCLPGRIAVTSWNIGYCGLGKDADFFYDGGKQVRSSKGEVLKNLERIEAFLRTDMSDFLLLQEVDVGSKRSYSIDEQRSIADSQRDGSHFFAYNYKAWFVPIPVFRPIGRVRAGLATFGRCAPYHVVRYAYPDATPYPQRIFQLKRCFLACRYTAQNGRDLVLVNTHNSAYDSGEQRADEMEMLRDFVMEEYENGSYVIVGGDWNQTPPGYEKRATTKQYTPHAVDSTLFTREWQWAYDRTAETMRFTNRPYDEKESLTSVVDFFLVSPNVEVVEVAVRKLGFEHSDHNPVTATFELK
ncbi:MAG: endonuclease/exonuclease/phosphatase family protein [Prevotellaceae bacterium]|jgi:endonuclease/exonuclease/phosphatase family metal-dependent hydrolase|nr:endonuclease/exonuclease/phosphatase family protein [Prevotellaceae bacterium]